MVIKVLIQWDVDEGINEAIKLRNSLIEYLRDRNLYTGFSTIHDPPNTFGIITKLGHRPPDIPYYPRYYPSGFFCNPLRLIDPPGFGLPIFEAEACGEPTILPHGDIWARMPSILSQPEGSRAWLANPKFLDWLEELERYTDDMDNQLTELEDENLKLGDFVNAKMEAPFVVTGLDYRGPYKKIWLRTEIEGKKYNLTAIPSKNFGELMSKATQFDNLIEEFGEDIPWLINTLEDEVDRRQMDTKMVGNLIDIVISIQSYIDRCIEKDIPIAPTLIQIGRGLRHVLPKGGFPT